MGTNMDTNLSTKDNLNEGGVLLGDVVRPLLLFVVVLRRGGVVL